MQAAEVIPALQVNLIEALQDEVHNLKHVMQQMHTAEQVPCLQGSTACYEQEPGRAAAQVKQRFACSALHVSTATVELAPAGRRDAERQQQ